MDYKGAGGLKRPAIFITSAGRTATQFFGLMMSRMIEDCVSVHEPDVLWIDRPGQWSEKIRAFGLLRMTAGRFSPRTSLRALNIARRSGRVDEDVAVKYLKELRRGCLETAKARIYLEANSQFNALVDLLPRAFPNSRIVLIIRDPRAWVRSWMNMTVPIYSRRDIRSWFKNSRLTPYHIDDSRDRNRWKAMDLFERLCWAWNAENGYALERAAGLTSVKVFRYEDLFAEQSRDETFSSLMRFVTTFPDGLRAQWSYRPELLSRKLHSTSGGKFPGWRQWEGERARILDRHCRPLMERFGYGTEDEWKELARD